MRKPDRGFYNLQIITHLSFKANCEIELYFGRLALCQSIKQFLWEFKRLSNINWPPVVNNMSNMGPSVKTHQEKYIMPPRKIDLLSSIVFEDCPEILRWLNLETLINRYES